MNNESNQKGKGTPPDLSEVNIHNEKDDIQVRTENQPDDFLLGKIEDLRVLKPILVEKEQKPLFKGKPYQKLKRDQDLKSTLFSPSKKLQSRKKTSWKRRVFNLACILILGVVTGSILGGWYKNYADSQTQVNYPESEEPYLDNTNLILANALGRDNPTESELRNFALSLKAQHKSPLNFSASQNFILATYKASLASSYLAVGRGKVATIATQSVYSVHAYDGKKYELTSQSKGLMTVAICAVHEKGSNNVNLIHGTNIQDESADWNGENKKYTTNEFVGLNGSLPDRLSPYVVSSKTVLNEGDIQIEFTTYNDKPVYAYTMKLDPVLGAINYHKQVMLTSGLASSPKFSEITMTIYLDDEWNFVHTDINEIYVVKYGIPATCNGTLSTDYSFNCPVTMPY